MINVNTLRSELLQITAVILALLAVGMISWMGWEQSIQDFLGGNTTPISAPGDLWVLVEGNENSSLAVDTVLSGSADVRGIRANIEYDTANGTTRVLYLVSAQSCYQALSTKMQQADYLSNVLINDGLKMDVVVYGKHRSLRHELLLYEKMHKPTYNLFYWMADWDEHLPFKGEIALVRDGKMIAEMSKENMWTLQEGM